MLPLAVGMPLMHHVNRNPEKQHSWILDENERTQDNENEARALSHVPQVVFVDFCTNAWKIYGIEKSGECPIVRTTWTW
jgi:hypothetical protein